MISKKAYRIANHVFFVEMHSNNNLWLYLNAYEPFECNQVESETPLFILQVGEDACSISTNDTLVADFDGDLVNLRVGKGTSQTLVEFKSSVLSTSATLAINGEGKSYLTLTDDVLSNLFNLNNALMLLFSLRASKHQTLLFHSSVVESGGKGYMFLGRSGTGKSTHSRLWLESIRNAELLNDDNPAVRITDGIPYVYGTPWSGKTPCYQNKGVVLHAITRIIQAPYNKVEPLRTVKSYASVLPACSCAKWDKTHTNEVHQTIEMLIAMVSCYQLECLPNAEAAELCHEKVSV